VNFLSGRLKEIGIVAIIVIVALSFTLLFYIESITEASIRKSLFDEQKQRQIDSTKSISQHIGSDLSLVMSMLDGLANSLYLQQGDLYGDQTNKLLEEKYNQYNSVINRLFVLDKNDIVTNSLAPKGSETFLGQDFSLRDWIKETRATLKPVFSDGFERQGIYRIFITYPIIERGTGEYIGTIATSIPTVGFFAHYGNVEHLDTQFLVVFNKKGIMLANGASKTLVGQDFFSDYTQQFIRHNKILNDLTRNLLAGNSGYAVYNYGRGERLTSDYPIFVQGKPTYFIQEVTPTTSIYSQVNSVLFTEREKMFLLFASSIAAIVVLIIFFVKWNSTLDIEVKRRTKELNESNMQLESANEQLKLQEKMQKEFINVAAHELRTPVQPILGLSQMLRSKIGNPEQNEFLDVIIRNAKRLQRLTEDILDVTRIESQLLKPNKERFNLNDAILSSVEDCRNQIEKAHGNIRLLFEPKDIIIEADKGRIVQVVSNLLNNAVKFTRDGTVYVEAEQKADQVIVSIEDTGQGIDPEILPRLFSKFATKSFSGTGLGLFISKSIIESHGGKIWAENNSIDGKRGATFYFSLPIVDHRFSVFQLSD
jgi:signal transduction histidine kinase